MDFFFSGGREGRKEAEIGLGEVTGEVTSSVPIGRCWEAAPSGKVASLAAEMDDPERCALAYE